MPQNNKVNFKRDLSVGKQGEALLQAVLLKAGIQTVINEDSNKNKFWDLRTNTEPSVSFEVKYDIYAARSGNIAIEFYNPKTCKDSGINCTKADIWAHILTKPSSVWISRVNSLKEFCKNNKPFKVIVAGGDDNASLYLYKQDFILESIFIRIDEQSPENLLKLIRSIQDGSFQCSNNISCEFRG